MKAIDDRPLTSGEKKLARAMFGLAINLSPVRLRHSKWAFFHPKGAMMAPCGHVHVHPESHLWREDYSQERVSLQALLLHELTHVWQAQQKGKFYLPLMRHPFCRYDYAIRVGRPFDRYGIEQQAEIVRHAFLLRNKVPVAGAPPLATLESILPFSAA
jgi:hypothetical protein